MSQVLPPDGDVDPPLDQRQQPGRRSGAGASTAMEAMLGKRGMQTRETKSPPDPTDAASTAPASE